MLGVGLASTNSSSPVDHKGVDARASRGHDEGGNHFSVMSGVGPTIHAFLCLRAEKKDVDAG